MGSARAEPAQGYVRATVRIPAASAAVVLVVAEAEDPDDGDITLGRAIHHHRRAWIAGGRGAHENPGLGSRSELPEPQRDQQGGGESAAERPLGSPSTRRAPYGSEHPAILDAAHDARPEAGPVGIPDDRGAGQERMETAQLAGLALAHPTSGHMSGRRARRPLVQGAVQPRAQSPSRAITGQHVGWTAPPRAFILMAAS
jgi:hypothetical protein